MSESPKRPGHALLIALIAVFYGAGWVCAKVLVYPVGAFKAGWVDVWKVSRDPAG